MTPELYKILPYNSNIKKDTKQGVSRVHSLGEYISERDIHFDK